MTSPRPLADLVARLRAAADSRSTRVIDEELYKEAAAALEECSRERDKAREAHEATRGGWDVWRDVVENERKQLEARIADFERRLAAPLPEEIERCVSRWDQGLDYEAGFLLARTARALEECARDFEQYAHHLADLPSCRRNPGPTEMTGKCDCGLEAARKRWSL